MRLIEYIQGIRELLSAKEKLQLVAISALICASALFETLGVASILPYMSLLMNPNSGISAKVFGDAVAFFGEKDQGILIIYIGFFVLFGLVSGTILSGVSTWVALNFSMLRIHSISRRVLTFYLAQDYEFFLQNNSSTLLKNLLSEVGNVVGGVLTPLIQMGARVLVALMIVLLLFSVNAEVASVSLSVFLILYIAIYMFTRRRLSRMGKEAVIKNEQRYQVLNELFGGIREVKLWRKERFYLSMFSRSSSRFAQLNSQNQLIALFPRYALEIIAFGGLLVVTIMLTARGENFSDHVPLLSLYAAAGYKLLPSMQQIFVNLSAIRFSIASLEVLLNQSKNWNSVDAEESECSPKRSEDLSNPEKEIRFKDIIYSYPDCSNSAVGPLNLVIPVYSTIGIIGASGSGKSTLLDLLLGLLSPSSGKILVDGQEVSNNVLSTWSEIIGYVPQNVYLTEGTVAENIAFGIDRSAIDMIAVKEAAKTAQIATVINKLPQKYDTPLGERGLRLSGGQRQRVAIARALYRNPEIIVFDEATSALDEETEKAVMEAVHSLAKRKTILIVTHRHSTLKECDRIYMLDKGVLMDAADFDSKNTVNISPANKKGH
jgi:ABC-type multidrug transport system fused ATPase/permease subunit